MARVFLTTTIPYVNAPPHLGFTLEAVQADVLARHLRQRGAQVRLLSGTDDNSLKNVLAAEAAGVNVREWVDRHADAFAALAEPLALSYDDFIRTSSDQRHEAGVERLWRACAASGDFYRDRYEGWYCVGCESYYTVEDLVGGRCPEHGTEPQWLSEENWFFRLSRYAEPLREAITGGELRIEPEQRRNEVLGLIAAGLRDFSVSRSRQRAHGWGIPVPDDPEQVIYVWWDALGNYVTSLEYGTGGDAFQRWWVTADRRVHLLGKGVLRFHAVYWPALLLSAGLPLPTDIVVHDYLTVAGEKLSKSTGGGADPVQLVEQFGTDAVRWWLLREVPRIGDADFTVARLVERADAELAGGIGNLLQRVVTMVHKFRDGQVPEAAGPQPGGAGPAELWQVCQEVPAGVDAALARYDFRAATGALWRIVEQANRQIEQVRPWELARAERSGDESAGPRLDRALAELVAGCRTLAAELAPFLPGAAATVTARVTAGPDGRLPQPQAAFSRLATSAA